MNNLFSNGTTCARKGAKPSTQTRERTACIRRGEDCLHMQGSELARDRTLGGGARAGYPTIGLSLCSPMFISCYMMIVFIHNNMYIMHLIVLLWLVNVLCRCQEGILWLMPLHFFNTYLWQAEVSESVNVEEGDRPELQLKQFDYFGYGM